MHAAAAISAFNHGKHVYVEKPIASNLDDAQRVLDARRHSAKIGIIGFNLRCHPAYLQAKQQIREGRIGTLVGGRSTFCSALRSLPDWKKTRSTCGGVLLDLASHHVDLVRFLFDQEIREVAATVRSVHSEDDNASIELRLEDGVVIQSFYSMTAVEEDRFEIYGDRGKLTVDRYYSAELQHTPPKRRFEPLDRLGGGLGIILETPRRLHSALFPPMDPSYRVGLSNFVNAMHHGATSNPDLYEGYRSLAVIDAAERSAKINKPVTLNRSCVEVRGT
jgi:predicted dehydrogenase